MTGRNSFSPCQSQFTHMTNKQRTIADIRAFNRYYTRLIGLLNDHLLGSDYSLAEARVLYEIQLHQPISASQIVAQLAIDKGYLSRVLKQFEKKGLIGKEPSAQDARVTLISLKPKGRVLFNTLDVASGQQIERLVENLTTDEQLTLVGHMLAIMKLLPEEMT